MMERLRFSLNYAINDLRNTRRHATFALLCIAAGVAALVALGLLSQYIDDVLVDSYRFQNLGDLRISVPDAKADDAVFAAQADAAISAGALSVRRSPFGAVQYFFTQANLDQLLLDLSQAFPNSIANFTTLQSALPPARMRVYAPLSAIERRGVTVAIIDPNRFPLYGNIETLQHTPLAQAITGPNQIVVNQNLAEKLQAQVGDPIRLTGSDVPFILAGTVTESVNGDPQMALSGFAYLDLSARHVFSREVEARLILVRSNGTAQLQAMQSWLNTRYPALSTETVTGLSKNSSDINTAIGQLARLVGFISLLIGSLGVVNTMQVVLRRRLLEIATLKTLGLSSGNILLLFLLEAVLLGLLGSVIGAAAGIGSSLLLKQFARGFVEATTQKAIAQPIPLQIPLQIIGLGLANGTLMTVIFSAVPLAILGNVRPNVILRPNDVLTRFRPQPLALIVALAALLGFVMLNILRFEPDPKLAGAITLGTLVGFIILLVVTRVLVIFITRVLALLGKTRFKVAMRSVGAANGRSALVLLGLSVGTFCIAIVVIFASVAQNIFTLSVTQLLGGNIVVIANNRVSNNEVQKTVQDLNNVRAHFNMGQFRVWPISLTRATGEVETADALIKRLSEQGGQSSAMASKFRNDLHRITGLELPSRNKGQLLRGRALNPDDTGNKVALLPNYEWVDVLGVQPGDSMTLRFDSGVSDETYQIVGIIKTNQVSLGGDNIQIPITALPDDAIAQSWLTMIDSPDDTKPDIFARLKRIPNTFTSDAVELNAMLNQLLGQFLTMPILVGVMSLLAGSAVIANSVALATLERRNEFAIMKTLGLQREQVLGLLLAESAFLGLLGSALGVGSALAIMQIELSSPQMAEMPGWELIQLPYGAALLLIGFIVAVAILSAVLVAWRAAAEKPTHLLQYH